MIERKPSPEPRPRARAARALYEPLDGVTVRAPLLSVEAYRSLHVLSAADPRVRLALAVGSEALSNALDAEGTPQARSRLARKLRRFLTRMSTRPTPYGLFAGVGLARWDTHTDLALSAAPPRRRTRPDMDWLTRFVREIETRPGVREHLRFTANRLTVVRDGRAALPDASGEGAEAVSIKATGAVLATLERARTGASYAELRDALLAHTAEATPEKVARLLEQMCAHAFLWSDVRPPLFAAAPAAYVLDRLAGIPEAAEALTRLRTVVDAAAAFDAASEDAALARYRELVQLASDGAADASGNAPVQVDMALPLVGERLARTVGEEAARAAELLVRLSPMPASLPVLAPYRQAFVARYGGAREVPLLELLDPVAGLGSPMRTGHAHGGAHGGAGGAAAVSPADAAKAQARSRALQHAAYAALRAPGEPFELDAATIARLELWPGAHGAPRTVDLMLFLAAESAAAIDRGDFEIVVGPNLGASSAGRNLGRFADLLGDEATAALAGAARAEEDGRRIFAELVYAPSGARMMNVSIRPCVRTHAIVHGVAPGIAPENVIPLDELTVGVHGDRFYVRWARDGREVVPCTGHMLNYNRAPLPFRFLDLIAREGCARFSSFDWGPAESFPYLPRVTSGRIVLRPAEWKLDRFSAAYELGVEHGETFLDAVRRWRARWSVPRFVFLATGDNRLSLDLDDADQTEELRRELDTLRDGWQLTLQEVVPAHDRAWLAGPDGRYVTEIVASLRLREMPVVEPAPARTSAPHIAGAAPTIDPRLRLRPPGSEWLFAKIYGSPGRDDELIAGPLRELADGAVAAGHAKGWFFLRYADPEPHLRLRFHGEPRILSGTLMPAVCERLGELVESGSCARFVFDTYDREIERYGGAGAIEICEELFCLDSATVAELLHELREPRPALDRLVVAVASIDHLLASLGMSPEARLSWYKTDYGDRRDGGEEYRRHKTALRSLLGGAGDESSAPWLSTVLERRRDALGELGARLFDLERDGRLTVDVATICRSLVHMHCNRLLTGAQGAERTAVALLARTWQGLLHERRSS
ncbi:MAG TPA: lantibiotic dehydratase [Candidatus Limnocylindrales bacterium]|nr:lantibiotic dehydratase [Candidatus Limnocylindrales bacterium]